MAAAGLVALRGRAASASTRTTSGPAASPTASPRSCPARSIRRQVETNMVFVDTEAVGLPLLDDDRAAARPSGVGATHGGRQGPHGDPRRRRRRRRRRRAGRLAIHRARRREGGVMGLFTKNVPRGDRRRGCRPDSGWSSRWPVLHYGPIPKFDGTDWDLEVSGLVEHPFTLSYAGAARAAERHGRRRHALRDRLDHARQHVGGRLVPHAHGDGEAAAARRSG